MNEPMSPQGPAQGSSPQLRDTQGRFVSSDAIANRIDQATGQAPEGQQVAPMPSAQQTTQDDLTLPPGVSERTAHQWDKMHGKLSEKDQLLAEKERRIQELEAQAQRPQDPNAVFDIPSASQQAEQRFYQQFPSLSQNQVDAVSQQYVDQEGNVDVYALNRALSEANDRARIASEQVNQMGARLQHFEESFQAREAHAVYPQIDPQSPQFNQAVYEMVRDRIIRNRYQGVNQTLVQVTGSVMGEIQRATQPTGAQMNQAVEQYKQSQQNRNQGPFESGSGGPRQPMTNMQDLKERTRKGDTNAISARLEAIGF